MGKEINKLNNFKKIRARTSRYLSWSKLSSSLGEKRSDDPRKKLENREATPARIKKARLFFVGVCASIYKYICILYFTYKNYFLKKEVKYRNRKIMNSIIGVEYEEIKNVGTLR